MTAETGTGAAAPRARRARALPDGSLSAVEVAALLLGLLWLVLSAWIFLTYDADAIAGGTGLALVTLTTMLGVVLPAVLIYVAVAAAQSNRQARHETERLRHVCEQLRKEVVLGRTSEANALREALHDRLGELAAGQAELRRGLRAAREASAQPPAPDSATAGDGGAPDAPASQRMLALGTEAPPGDLSVDDLIRTLDFPRNDRDVEGFDVLKRALTHPPTARLVSAAQDVLTLLSQDGIYMEDLLPEAPDPTAWRAFAAGARDATVAPVGAIHDRSALALVRGRMKEDAIFREAVLEFLRRFDQGFAALAARASDPQIARFAESRTARAFMLLGRAAGTFG